MKLLNLLMIFFAFSITATAQECETSEFLKKGTKWEISSFNKKGKLNDVTKYETIDEEHSSNRSSWNLMMKVVDKKGEEVFPETSTTIICENGIYMMDMSQFMPTESIQGMKDMDVQIESSNLNFPSTKNVNALLEDGSIQISAFSSGIQVMSVNLTISDRKIEGIETIKTEAGEFECLKITQNTTVSNKLFTRTIKSTSWFLPGFGVVKSESYNKKEKTIGSSELSSLTRL